MNTVTSPDASRSHTAPASNAPGASQHAPTASGVSVTLTSPWTWFSGSTSTVRSAADHAHAATIPSTIAASCRGCARALRPPGRAARVDHQRRAVGAGAKRWTSPRGDVDDGSPLAGEAVGARRGGRRGDDGRRAAVADAYASSASGFGGCSGTAMAPACQQASTATTKSWPAVARMATRSPWSTGRAPASAAASSSIAANVHVPPGRRSPRRSPCAGDAVRRSAPSSRRAATTRRPPGGAARSPPPGLGGAQQRDVGALAGRRAARRPAARRRRSRPAATAPGSRSR